MPKVRFDPDKFQRRAAAAAGEYESGVLNPRRSQSQTAIASKGNWELGVTEAISAGRYEKGLQASGDGKWQKGVREKGRARYSQGVGVAGDEWSRGFSPHRQAIESLDLGPKGPKGQNYGRVEQIGELLRRTKQGA